MRINAQNIDTDHGFRRAITLRLRKSWLMQRYFTMRTILMRCSTLFALLLACSISTASSQSLSVFNLDASGFLVVKAKLYAFDAGAQQSRPSASEISVNEDGVSRTVLSVTCPPQQPAPPVSLA